VHALSSCNRVKGSGWLPPVHAKLLRSTFDRNPCGPMDPTSPRNSCLQAAPFGVSHACLETLRYEGAPWGERLRIGRGLIAGRSPRPTRCRSGAALYPVACVLRVSVAIMCRMLERMDLLPNKNRCRPPWASPQPIHHARTGSRKQVSPRLGVAQPRCHENAEDSIVGGHGAYVRGASGRRSGWPWRLTAQETPESVQTLRLRPILIGKTLYCLKKSNTLLAGMIGITIPPRELIGS
jgi:hypothetical protein